MTGREPEKQGETSIIGFFLTFIFTLMVARVVIDLVQHGATLNAHTWITPSAWIGPAGFAFIACFAYWYRTRH